MLRLVFIEITKVIDIKIIRMSYASGVKIVISVFFSGMPILTGQVMVGRIEL
jgi:hypothetical protein